MFKTKSQLVYEQMMSYVPYAVTDDLASAFGISKRHLDFIFRKLVRQGKVQIQHDDFGDIWYVKTYLKK